MKVAIVGMGFVGLTLSVVVSKFHRVYGIEIRPDVVELLNSGTPHFFEEGLSEQLKASLNSRMFSAHQSTLGLPIFDIVIVTVGTPLVNGKMNEEMLYRAVVSLKNNIGKDTLIILRSTVFVGGTTKLVVKQVEGWGISPEIAMCPERTIEGNAINELVSLPQIIGASTESARTKARLFFESIGVVECVMLPSVESAEFAKLAANTYRDVNFAFANELAILAEAAGVDAHAAISAVNHNYPRSNIPKPGLVGGPCLEKDSHILAQSYPHLEQASNSLLLASRRVHVDIIEGQLNRLKNFTAKFDLATISGILVAGLAFKGEPETDDIRGTPAKEVISAASRYFPAAYVYGTDPFVSEQDAMKLGVRKKVEVSWGVENTQVIILQHAGHTLVRQLHAALEEAKQPKLVLDFWNSLYIKNTNVKVMTFGKG